MNNASLQLNANSLKKAVDNSGIPLSVICRIAGLNERTIAAKLNPEKVDYKLTQKDIEALKYAIKWLVFALDMIKDEAILCERVLKDS